MNGFKTPRPALRRRRGWRLLAVLCLLMAGLGLFFPLVRLAVNHLLLPLWIASPQVALESARLDQLSGHGMTLRDVALRIADGRRVRADRLELWFSPASLWHRSVPMAHAGVSVESSCPVTADLTAREIQWGPDGIRARVTARFAPLQAGALQVGAFCVTARVDGATAVAETQIPLHDGQLMAQGGLVAEWRTTPEWRGHLHLPLIQEDGSPVQIDGLPPAVGPARLSGSLSVEAVGIGSASEGTAELHLASLEMPQHSLTVSNLHTRCGFRLSGGGRSLPEQNLTVEALAVGGLRLAPLRMRYQLEEQGVLLIEELEAGWCNGRVSLYGARCGLQRSDWTLQLFCDRLNLEQVFRQFGLKALRAGGELNGRLPVQRSSAGWRVDRGFLYTTPGQGGVLSLGRADAIAGLLPAGSVQAGQLGLVAAALEEFEYDWITLTLNSEGETLRVDASLSGRPAQSLPFEYDARSGTYVRIAPSPGRGLRQPMRLDLHFRIPLDSLLWYAAGVHRGWNDLKQAP